MERVAYRAMVRTIARSWRAFLVGDAGAPEPMPRGRPAPPRRDRRHLARVEAVQQAPRQQEVREQEELRLLGHEQFAHPAEAP